MPPLRRVLGTPLYMAPEQIVGAPGLDHRCDLYAVGGVAYMLLTGHPPFPGVDSALVMASAVRDPITPPRKIRPDVPEDLERVVLRCLAKARGSALPGTPPTSRSRSPRRAAHGRHGTTSAAALWWHDHELRGGAPD